MSIVSWGHLSSQLAYIDGGSASLLFQALIGGLLAVGYYVATGWARFKASTSQILARIAHKR